jgi:hypothetical protein
MKDACIFVSEDFFQSPCGSIPDEGKIQLATSETKRSQNSGQPHFLLTVRRSRKIYSEFFQPFKAAA